MSVDGFTVPLTILVALVVILFVIVLMRKK